jgi:hypothetical protein
MRKLKASFILQHALERIKDGRQRYACAAIQDVETELRWKSNDEVRSNALKVFHQFKPSRINDSLKTLQEWWPGRSTKD